MLYGVSFFKLPDYIKKINAFLGATLLVALLLNFINKQTQWFDYIKQTSNTTGFDNQDIIDEYLENGFDYSDKEEIPLDSNVVKSTLEFNSPSGVFHITSGEGKSGLLKFHSIPNPMLLKKQDTLANKVAIVFFTDNTNQIVLDGNLDDNFDNQEDKQNTQEASVFLSPAISWSINSNVGLGEYNFDMSNILLDSLNLTSGAAKINITMGNQRDSSFIVINSAATDLSLKYPKELVCIIKSNVSLSGQEFPNFIKIGKNTFQSKNTINTNKRLFVEINGGISSYKIRSY